VLENGQHQEQAARIRLAEAPPSERKQLRQKLREVRNEEAVKLLDAQAAAIPLTLPRFPDLILRKLARTCEETYRDRGTKAALVERIGEWKARWEEAQALAVVPASARPTDNPVDSLTRVRRDLPFKEIVERVKQRGGPGRSTVADYLAIKEGREIKGTVPPARIAQLDRIMEAIGHELDEASK
jgi:hypothetical protein